MESSFKRGFWLLGGIAIGVGIMYILDPDRGRARRSQFRDRTSGLVLHTHTTLGRTARNLSNHARDAVAEANSRLRQDSLSDEELAERIRSHIAHLIAQPGSLHVAVQNGRVSLSGSILAAHVQKLIEQTAMTPGVLRVENRLTVYQSPAEMPGPQVERG